MAYQSWSVVFGEQPSAAKWNILGTNDAYFDSIIGSGTAWSSWVPTFTNFTLGNGTLNYAKYVQLGKTVHIRLRVTLGSTSSMGSVPNFTVPVDLNGDYDRQAIEPVLATVILRDEAPAGVIGVALWNTASTIVLRYLSGTATLSNITSTAPFTWASTDSFYVAATYESV